MTPIVVTPPAAEPITLAQAKDHLRVVIDDEDAYIASLITAARVMLEERTQRALMPRTLRIGLSGLRGEIRLPMPPLMDVTSVKYIDSDGTQQTLTGFQLDIYSEPARISAPYGENWPATRAQPGAAVIEYQAGYADADAVPAPLKQWMLLAIGALYENRESIVAGVSIAELPDDFMRWLWVPYMVFE